MIWLAGLAAVAGSVYVGQLAAQNGAQGQRPAAAPEPRTRVALLNLHYVIKNYAKYISFQNEMKEAVKPFEAKEAAKKAQADEIAKKASNPALPKAEQEALQKQYTILVREREDNKAEANKFLNTKSDEQLKILYLDVQDAATRYAMSHNFEMVLHYNDATTEVEYFSPANIAMKIQARSCTPMYAAPGLDISKEVLTALNAAAQRSASGPGTTGTPAVPR
jgi:Skp family chaperone for outer membrane proteins